MKAVLVLLLLGAAAVSALPSGTDNIMNRDERGVDCGGFGAPTCTCFSDLTRVPNPPFLVNENNNSANASAVETGIQDNDLHVVVRLDPRVYIASAVNADGFFINTTEPMFRNGTGFEPSARRYQNPVIRFVNYSANSDNILTGCNMVTDANPTKPAYTYGTNGSSCGATSTVLRSSGDLTDALRTCGWKEIENVVGTGTGDFADAAQRYTVYEGKFKVITDKYNGNLRGREVILREEFPFWIQIQFPEIVNVSSNNVSVIGAVVEQAALTHQIWDTSLQEVDLNAFIGVSYPYALASSEGTSVGAPGGSLQLTLVANWTADASGFCNGKTLLPIGDAACTNGQTVALYRAGSVCDRLPAGCGLEDFFDLTNTTVPTFGANPQDYDIPTLSSQFTSTFAFSGGSALPATSCPGQNVGTANDKACKQNLHLRLKPRSGWCDLNFRFLLTVGVVCRDDADGDTINELADSWIADGSNLTNGVTNRLTTNTGAILPCNSTAAPDKQVSLQFSLASDDFCARVIETATITSVMSVYESESINATWGARCPAGVCGDLSTDRSATCAASGEPGTRHLCRQVPGLYADSDAAVSTTTRKTQSQFVFGTTTYLETRVSAEAGVNIASTIINRLWISSASRTTNPAPDASNIEGIQGFVDQANWLKKLHDSSVSPLPLTSYRTGVELPGATSARVIVSNEIANNSMITNYPDYFKDAVDANPATPGSEAHRLGKHFEGVSRASVLLDEYTVHISDAAEEAAESVKFWAGITITYKPASQQETLATHHMTTSSAVPSGFAARAGLLTAPALTGRTVSAQGSVRPSAGSGTAGSSSTIAGFSSTTVVAAAVVVGAVALAAVVGLVVVRKRRVAARSTKRTSSTQELNDTAQVQV